MLLKLGVSLGVVLVMVLLPGCEKAMHDMYDQRKYKPLAASDLFSDGQSARPLPPGTIVHSGGALAGASSGRIGEQPLLGSQGELHPTHLGEHAHEHAGVSETNPLPITQALLRHGQERYNIYCAPCHSPLGDGDGMVARRGFPHPPSYHTDRLRNAPDAHFFSVITQGYGVMYPYADRLSEHDRWAVVAYIRALQLSQHAELAAVPEEARQQIEERQ
jgi:mono/diheme cytochrome c family protein